MQEFEITLRSLTDILDFVALAQAQPFPVFAGNAHQMVSAKSYMGMCALDYSQTIRIQAECEAPDYDAFRAAARRFLYT